MSEIELIPGDSDLEDTPRETLLDIPALASAHFSPIYPRRSGCTVSKRRRKEGGDWRDEVHQQQSGGGEIKVGQNLGSGSGSASSRTSQATQEQREPPPQRLFSFSLGPPTPLEMGHVGMSPSPTGETYVERSSPHGQKRGWVEKMDSVEQGIKEDGSPIEKEDEAVIIPKVELLEDEDTTFALLDTIQESNTTEVNFPRKRPRGRPRKHPLVPPNENKIMKGRSKTGCITCRRRKKKCDEKKPTCENCKKNNVTCEGYPSRLTWKSGKEKADEGALSRLSHAPEERYSLSPPAGSQLAIALANIGMQPVIHGVETASDIIFFEHYVFRLSGVLTVEGPEKNVFKEQLLPMAVQHLGLMHSILALSSSNIDYTSDYGKALLANHPNVTQKELEERAEFHEYRAMEEFRADIARQEAGVSPNAILKVRFGQMLCWVIQGIAQGRTAGEHRVHLKAYQELMKEAPPEDSPFMDFIHEYFQYHIVFDELISPPKPYVPEQEQSDTSQYYGSSPPPALPTRTEVGSLFGLQDDKYFSFMRRISTLRNKIRYRMENDLEPVVDYQSLYNAASIDSEIREWAQASAPPSPAACQLVPVNGAEKFETREKTVDTMHVAGLLYKQMLWVYLWRTIYPPTATTFVIDPKITSAVDDAISLLKLFHDDDKCQTTLLSPAFLIGCAAFEPEQRDEISHAVRRVKAYNGLRNADIALEVLENVWRRMDRRDVRSWDWQAIAHEMGKDFLAT